MNASPTDDSGPPEKKRFETSLKEVAERLGVPLSTVRSWRHDEGCPFLQKRPYDISAVRQWLNKRDRAKIDPNSEIERRKLELEVRELEREGRVFSRDKAYWLAVAAAGIGISNEIRQWLKESRASHETDLLPQSHAVRSSSMPKQIVEEYQPIYRHNFMRQTLDTNIQGDEFKVAAFSDQGDGFPECYIIVDFKGMGCPKIWACNVVQKKDDGTYDAVIHVSSDFFEQPAFKRKMILAHEWIEVMMAFRDGERPSKQIDLDKVQMAILFNILQLRAPWQDSLEFDTEMHGALRTLLVSGQSIRELAEEFGTAIETIQQQVKAEPAKAGAIIRKIAATFNARHSVDLPLVFDRFRDVLWG